MPAVWLALTVGVSSQPKADDLKFAWAVGAWTGPTDARKAVPVTGEITLRSGDELKIFFNQVTPSFAYVLHEDPKNELSVMHPEGSLSKNATAARGRHYVPPGEGWLTLDDETGTERIYLIASSTRLTALEQLLGQYAGAPPTARAGARTAIIGELARLDKQSARASWSERPLTIGGQVRGPKPPRPDVAHGAKEVTTPGYFSQTLVIEHR